MKNHMLSSFLECFKRLKFKKITKTVYSFSFNGFDVCVVSDRFSLNLLKDLKDKLCGDGYYVFWDKDLGYCFFKENSKNGSSE